MELHENLYALGQQLGREVFDDPDTFRGALDDFLDEDSATTGDINLLVDAVRLGAFSSMTSMIGSGAQVTAAVEEAGKRMARDRGSADVAGAQWACAMLAFAIGKAGDAEVRRYRTQHTSQELTPDGPSTELPQAPQGPIDPGPTRNLEAPLSVPVPGAAQEPQAPTRKRRTWPIIVAAAAAGVVAAVVVTLVIQGGGDDSDDDSNGGGGGTDPTALSADLEAVQKRYSGLADDVTAGVDECEAADTIEGTTEVLECGFADGTLTLATYESDEVLDTNRTASIGLEPGSRYSSTDAGAIYSVDATADFAEAETSSLYWDSTNALQAGKYVLSAGVVGVDRLVKMYDRIDGAVPYPTKPEDKGMIALAEAFLNVGQCDRIQTNAAGELEESYCPAPHGIDVWIVAFETMEDFQAYRALRVGWADPNGTQNYWNFGDETQGTLADYENENDGSAVRYWDQLECKCSMEAFLASGDREVLTNWWLDPFPA